MLGPPIWTWCSPFIKCQGITNMELGWLHVIQKILSKKGNIFLHWGRKVVEGWWGMKNRLWIYKNEYLNKRLVPGEEAQGQCHRGTSCIRCYSQALHWSLQSQHIQHSTLASIRTSAWLVLQTWDQNCRHCVYGRVIKGERRIEAQKPVEPQTRGARWGARLIETKRTLST